MTKSQYPYAPDEFDVPAPEGSPVGVHRALRSTWSKTWPFLLVAVLFSGLAYGAIAYLSSGDTAPPAATPTSTATEEPTDDEGTGDDGSGADGSDDGEGSDDGTDGTGDEDGTEDGADDGTEGTDDGSETDDIASLLAVADTGAHVRVLNDGGPAGEAGSGKAALDGQGFTNVEAADYPAGGSGVSVNTIWYTADRADTAAAVAAVLGIPAENVSEQALRSGDVMVVIKGDLPGAG